MITILSFLIEHIYYFLKNWYKKYRCFIDTLNGKTDSIVLLGKSYEITEEKKKVLIKFVKYYNWWKKMWIILAWIVHEVMNNTIPLNNRIIILIVIMIVPTQLFLYLGGIHLIKKKI